MAHALWKGEGRFLSKFEGIPAGATVGRKINLKEVKMETQLSLRLPCWMKLLESLMPGSLLLAYLITVIFGAKFPGVK